MEFKINLISGILQVKKDLKLLQMHIIKVQMEL